MLRPPAWQRYLYLSRSTLAPERLSPRPTRVPTRRSRLPLSWRPIPATAAAGLADPLTGHEILRTLIDNAGTARPAATLRKGPSSSSASPGVGSSSGLLMNRDFAATRKYPLPSLCWWTGQLHGDDVAHTTLALCSPAGLCRGGSNQPRPPAPLGRAWRIRSIEFGVLEPVTKPAARSWRSGRMCTPADWIWGWSYALHDAQLCFSTRTCSVRALPVSLTHWTLYDKLYRAVQRLAARISRYDRGSPLTYVNGLKGTCASMAAATTTCTSRTVRS